MPEGEEGLPAPLNSSTLVELDNSLAGVDGVADAEGFGGDDFAEVAGLIQGLDADAGAVGVGVGDGEGEGFGGIQVAAEALPRGAFFQLNGNADATVGDVFFVDGEVNAYLVVGLIDATQTALAIACLAYANGRLEGDRWFHRIDEDLCLAVVDGGRDRRGVARIVGGDQFQLVVAVGRGFPGKFVPRFLGHAWAFIPGGAAICRVPELDLGNARWASIAGAGAEGDVLASGDLRAEDIAAWGQGIDNEGFNLGAGPGCWRGPRRGFR